MVTALAMLGSSQVLKLAMPWMAAQAIDAIQTTGTQGLASAARWIAGVVALSAGVWMLHGPGRVIERNVALRVRRRVADALYERLSRAPLAWHDAHHSGELQHRVHQASGALFDFTQNQFIYLQNAVNLLGPLVALLLLSPTTGMLAFGGYAAIATVIVSFDIALMRLAERENQAERRYAARLLDVIGNVGSLFSLRLQDAARRLLDRELLAVFVPLRRSIVLTEWKWCAVDLFTIGLSWGLVVAYAWQAGNVAGNTVLLGSLFMVYQYAQQAAGVVGSMASNFQAFARTKTDFASAAPIWQAPQRIAAHHQDASWRRIDISGLSYRHAARGSECRGTGVHDIALTLHRGERIALVGPSGSGKSTLLRVLAGLYEPANASLTVDGVQQPGQHSLGAWATLIPQDAEVFDSDLQENLCFGEPVAESALREALYVSAFDEVLQTLPHGLSTPMSERGTTLSGGQRKRLALARGVLAARGSSLLLLDEPTSALDPLTEHWVHERLMRSFTGACIVASVHRMALLPAFDRVALMLDGRIVDIGTPDQLALRQPLFAQMLCGSAQPREAAVETAATA